MTGQPQQPRKNPTMNGNGNGNATQQPENVTVQAKVSWVPMILTTFVTTGVAVVTTIFVTRHFEKKREERELAAEREREDRAMMNPPMPMMWPGMGSQQNPQGSGQSSADFDQLTERLQAWERGLTEREQAIGAREHHLRLVMGGGEE